MKVLKFGGSSVGSPERIMEIVEIIKNSSKKYDICAVVCSAYQSITDQLIKAANLAQQGDESFKTEFLEIKDRHLNSINQLVKTKDRKNRTEEKVNLLLQELENVLQGIFLIRELSPKSLDLIMSFGERLSNTIIAETFNENGIQSDYLDTRNIVKTDENFNNASVNFRKTNQLIKEYFTKNKKLQVTTGFIGSTEHNETTTLGRGGSDYTASILGAALQAEEIEIWTDVNGVMTTDPRKVQTAFTLDEMTYQEAMEMSHFGAKVIYAPTMQPAKEKNIPIRIKNTFNPDFEGTVIKDKISQSEFAVKGISSISDISLVTISGSGMVGISGVSSRIFSALAKEKINIILITQASSEYTITFAVNPNDEQKSKEVIEAEFKSEIIENKIDEVKVQDNLAIVAIVGEKMKNAPGISASLFSALGNNKINVVAIAQGSSERNISVVIFNDDLSNALVSIHNVFFDRIQEVNLFIAGVGLIGSELINQIAKSSNILQNSNIMINVLFASNSKGYIYNKSGFDHKNIIDTLSKNSHKLDVKKIKELVLDSKCTNKVFVDCTPSEKFIPIYSDLLENGISVVTPNKKANSEIQELYNQLHKPNKGKFLYETNVGAGLPIIQTLQDLIKTGDKIIKIEGVFSGTLSYIFNNFDSSKKFSEVVKQAKQLGYTEPDPRDDLNGIDFARKLLILAREIGMNVEMKDIKINSLVSKKAENAKSIEEFFEVLEKEDRDFANIALRAEKNNKKLRFIGEIENSQISLKLVEVSDDHPTSGLKGSENIVIFKTERYKDYPLTIKGPGAGASVTAAGVLSDILKTLQF